MRADWRSDVNAAKRPTNIVILSDHERSEGASKNLPPELAPPGSVPTTAFARVASAGTADAIGGRVSVLGAKFGLELERTALLADGGEQYVLRIAPVAANTSASEIVDQWSVRAEKPISPTQNFTSVINTVITVKQKQHFDINVTHFNPGDDAHILYLAPDGSLQLGKWGAQITSLNQIVLFQHGGLIGIKNNNSLGDSWSTDGSDICYNITNRTNADLSATWSPNPTLSSLPYFTTPHGLGPGLATSLVSDAAYHNWTNIAAGKGDPCRMAGLTAQQVRNAGSVDKLAALQYAAINGHWRTPTREESIAFVGSDSNILPSDYGCWASTSPGIMSLPIKTTMYATKMQYKLPASGMRGDGVGYNNYVGSRGQYWLASPHPEFLSIRIESLQAIASNYSAHCNPVRCVPQ